MRNVSAQKGFSPILIIVLIVVGFVLVYGASVVLRSNANDTVSMEEGGSSDDSPFKIRETDSYVFEYPSNFKETQNPDFKDSKFLYEDPKTTRTNPAFIFLYIKESPEVRAGDGYRELTLKDCQSDADKNLRSTDQKIVRVNVVSGETYTGCFQITRTQVPNMDDALIMVEQVLVPLKSHAGVSYYMVRGGFFESDHKDIKDAVELSVGDFKLK